MPILQCYVDDRTMAILTEYGARNGRKVEDLAECAIAEAALAAIPPQARAPYNFQERYGACKDAPAGDGIT